ncbi:MAG: TonB-dependent receptor, partial [Bacteroidales bacterium]|nr:TonB-dependent receptor [Bacteroidales bacterium]
QLDVDVPIALTVFDSKKQDNFNFNQIDEMSRQIPGFLAINKSADFGVFGIRGVATDGVYSYEKVRISVYQDGVAINKPRESILELFDLDRVEVAKGPQSTLFGKGSEFGVVHFISNEPTRNFGLNVKTVVGNYGQRTVEAVVNTPLSYKVSNRLGIRYDAHDGYIQDVSGGRLNGKNTIAARNSTAFFINDDTKLKLNLVFQHDFGPSLSYKSQRIAPRIVGGSTSPFTAAMFTGGEGQEIIRDIYGVSADFSHDINSYWSFSNIAGFRGYNSKNGFDLDGTYLNLVNTRYKSTGWSVSDEARLNWDNRKRLHAFVGAGAYYDYTKVSSRHYGDAKIFAPMVIGDALSNILKEYPSQVAEGVFDGLLSYLYSQNGIKDPANDPIPDQLQPVFSTLALVRPSVVQALTQALNNKMYDWFHGTHWDASPDIIGETVETVQKVLAASITDLATQMDPALLAQLGGVEYLSSLSQLAGPMLMQNPAMDMVKSLSNLQMPDMLEENESHYNKTLEADVFGDITWQFTKKLFLTAGIRGTYETQEAGYSSSSDAVPIVGNMLFWPSPDGAVVSTKEDYYSWAGRVILNCKVDSTHNLFVSVAKGRSPAELYYAQRPDSVVSLAPENIINYEIGFKGISQFQNFYYYVAFYYYTWKNFMSSVSQATSTGSRILRSSDKGKARGFGFDGQLLYTFNDNVSTFLDLSLVNGKFSENDTKGNPQELANKKFVMMPVTTVDFGFNYQVPLSHYRNLHIHPMVAYLSKMYFTTENDENLCQPGYWMANANIAYSWRSRTERVNYEIGLYGKNLLNTKYLVSAGNGGAWFGFPTYVAGDPLTFGLVFRFWM